MTRAPDEAARFGADWLVLREPVDHRSRAHELAARLGHYWRQKDIAAPRIVDLGAGRGSNLRYLTRRLPGPAHWRLLDHDMGLLAEAVDCSCAPGAIIAEPFDLTAPLAPALRRADLVTASALLDLVSADWVAALCETCAANAASVLVALSIDGRIALAPPDPVDSLVCAAVARDQRRDKGFGPALGGEAPLVLAGALAARGYAVTARASDWRLDDADAPLARMLIEGWREAAQRQSPGESQAIAAWAERRLLAVRGSRLRLTVGHVDVLGLSEAR